jgi:hypothetical protein
VRGEGEKGESVLEGNISHLRRNICGRSTCDTPGVSFVGFSMLGLDMRYCWQKIFSKGMGTVLIYTRAALGSRKCEVLGEK